MKSERVFGAASASEAATIIQSNLSHGLQMLDAVVREQAPDTRLVLFPEFAFQGPPREESVDEWIRIGARTLPGPISEPLQQKATQFGIYIGANQFEFDPEWPGRFFNCCFLIAPSGEIILRYRRIYTAQWPSPHDFMDQYLARYGLEGTFPVVETELGRLAMYPCGEAHVPEAARMFMLRGAEILLHPDNAAATPTSRAPASPGPAVTATASISSGPTPAVASARSKVGIIASRWARLATSGTTPPNRACSSTLEATESASSS